MHSNIQTVIVQIICNYERTNSKNKNVESAMCLIENICDWMAMGYEFGDTAKEYYENNKDKINLPEWAIKEMYLIFDIIDGA